MLVLSRKLGEKLVIGEGANRVVVTVVHVERGKIRLGVEANRDIPVWRSELLPPDAPEPRAGGKDGPQS
jgi:carbon storage regulator